MINTKTERRKFKLKKMASWSKRLSLEHTIKFVTASDDEEFSENESSESESDSDESNTDYLDVSEKNLGGNVKSSLKVDITQVCLHFCVLYFCLNCLSAVLIFLICFPKT